MAQSHQPDNMSVDNERSLNKLAWAMEASVGRFKLVFARFNYTSLRSQLVGRLRELTKVGIRILELKPTERRLFARIQQELGEEQPDVLMVFGLESVDNLEQLLATTNQIREEFRKHFPFPLILWINDRIMEKLLRVAPDFESWGTTRQFVITTDGLIDFLQQIAEEFFAGNLTLSLEACQEIELACQELEHRGLTLDRELQATIESLLGFTASSHPINTNLDSALAHYRTGLALWQQGNQLEQQSKLLPQIALCYYLKALRYRQIDCSEWQVTRQYLQQCLAVFEQEQRLDLVANSILTG
ncbi:MAG: hypothetical protein F6K41_04190 [Symploca sp. SIO3E6]|nr:hypothetical protein [Caldora sp. SIO3E6]